VFAYNGDGVRTSKAVDSATTKYVLDLATTLPVVIGDTEAVYLYGLDIIAQQQSERLYYVHDGLGSVRQLVDTTGQIETNYAYDPFGVPLVGGEVYNPYQFTGEAWDAEVELLYLRARYYQPEVGRSITKDPINQQPSMGAQQTPMPMAATTRRVGWTRAVRTPSDLGGRGAASLPGWRSRPRPSSHTLRIHTMCQLSNSAGCGRRNRALNTWYSTTDGISPEILCTTRA
jgi:RHS repeat-associated protein